MDNMEIWNKFKQPEPKYLKEIKFGPLKGMSDIKPQWRLQAMTEVFGICGIGWKYTIDNTWTEEGAASLFNVSDKALGIGNTLMVFVAVSVYVKQDGEWSEAIPGIGGSSLREKNKYGLTDNDEASKMALTDALGVAFKALGVAADVYLGNFDGSKYKEEPARQTPPHEMHNWSVDFNNKISACNNPEELTSLISKNDEAINDCTPSMVKSFKDNVAAKSNNTFHWPKHLTGK